MENEEIIKSLVQCAVSCRKSGFNCLKADNIDELKDCIEINVLTAEICERSAEIMIVSNSNETDKLVEHCKTQLLLCIEECEKHNNIHCIESVSSCKKCVEICKNFILNISPK